MWEFFLALAMMFSLIPAMSVAVPTEENGAFSVSVGLYDTAGAMYSCTSTAQPKDAIRNEGKLYFGNFLTCCEDTPAGLAALN